MAFPSESAAPSPPDTAGARADDDGAPTDSPPVVGLGASAGGVDALKAFFAAVPADCGAAFVVIQHLDPDHPSHMSEVLAKVTDMVVTPAAESVRVQANHVYTIPANRALGIRDGRLRLSPAIKRHGRRMPIDFFFDALAEDQGERAVVVVLSGSGSDGTLGVRAVRGMGGLTMAQTPESASFDSMPSAAIASGNVDVVLPIEEMPGALTHHLARLPRSSHGPGRQRAGDELAAILDVVLAQTGCDFRGYKTSTVRRRIDRRVALVHAQDRADYLDRLRGSPDEVRALSQDMLVSVTRFFRESEAFDALRERVLAPLVESKGVNEPIRVWVPGCATGEEAYSIAMLLAELVRDAVKACPIHVFASDIDERALVTGRRGCYGEGISGDVGPERLERFFDPVGDGYEVKKSLRDIVTFAPQNVISDPPFSRLDLVSCRNLMIYLESGAQDRVQAAFTFALKPGGHLFLGRSDGVPKDTVHFEVVVKKWRIFRRLESDSDIAGPWGPVRTHRVDNTSLERTRRRISEAVHLAEVNQRVLLAHLDIGVVLIDPMGRILHFHGPTHLYLGHPTGLADLSLPEMVRDRLGVSLRPAIRRAGAGETVTLRGRRVVAPDRSLPVDVAVMPAESRPGRATLHAVIFSDVPASEASPIPPAGPGPRDEAVMDWLEFELETTRRDLEATIGELEATNEELTAVSEESMSMNEELQSTIEELETSREEQQSINEELNTVNAQLNEKFDESALVHNDLANLFNSTEVATLFLDTALNIKRFTPAATSLLNVIPSDLGRPVGDITQTFDADIQTAARAVMADLSSSEIEVETDDGRLFVMRTSAYRTLDDRIEGAVVTFSDITLMKRSEQAALAASALAETMFQSVPTPLLLLDSDLSILRTNASFCTTYRVLPDDARGAGVFEVDNRRWDILALRSALAAVVEGGRVVNLEIEIEDSTGQPGVVVISAHSVVAAPSLDRRLIVALEEITDRRAAEDAIQRMNRQLTAANRELESFSYTVAHDLKGPLRSIVGLCEMVLSGEEDLATWPKYLTRIASAAQHMFRLTSDLLALSTISHGTITETDVDLGAIARQIAADLALENPDRDLNFEIPDGLLVHGDQRMFRIALDNLLRNAVKFTGREPSARIAMGLDERDGERVFYIRDNGVGFDPDHAGRLFKAFQRVHTFGEFEGTGVGLATVERVISRHGGRVWAEGELGQGATMYFTVPDRC